MRTTFLVLALLVTACSSSARPEGYGRPCLRMTGDAGLPEGNLGNYFCADHRLTCTSSVLCLVGCTSDQDCWDLQPGRVHSAMCNGGLGCAFLCSGDGDCPNGLSCHNRACD